LRLDVLARGFHGGADGAELREGESIRQSGAAACSLHAYVGTCTAGLNGPILEQKAAQNHEGRISKTPFFAPLGGRIAPIREDFGPAAKRRKRHKTSRGAE